MDVGSDGDGTGRRVSQYVPGWHVTSSLDALEGLMDAVGTAPSSAAQRCGMSVTELHALRHLSRAALSNGELSRNLGVSTAGASGVVERLVNRGLANREPHPVDGRKSRVTITDLGHEVSISALLPMFSTLELLESSLSESEREVVSRYLRGATAAFRSLQ